MSDKEFQRPEDDPMTIAAIREGRHAWDIFIIECPACFTNSYYNQGSHASCYNCGEDLSDKTDDAITLEDYWGFADYPCDEPKSVAGESALAAKGAKSNGKGGK